MAVVTEQFSGTFTADPTHSSFLFAVKHMKVSTFRAGLGDVDARLVGDETGVTLEGRARVDSVSTGCRRTARTRTSSRLPPRSRRSVRRSVLQMPF